MPFWCRTTSQPLQQQLSAINLSTTGNGSQFQPPASSASVTNNGSKVRPNVPPVSLNLPKINLPMQPARLINFQGQGPQHQFIFSNSESQQHPGVTVIKLIFRHLMTWTNKLERSIISIYNIF
jgi:hypothetical protein